MGWPDEETFLDTWSHTLLMQFAGNGMHVPTIASLIICVFLGIAPSRIEQWLLWRGAADADYKDIFAADPQTIDQ